MAYESVNPFTEQKIKSFAEHSDNDVEQVLAQADAAYRQTWRGLSFEDRGAVLKRAVLDLRTNKDRFAKLVTLEMGKLFREACDEVNDCADIVEYYADHAAGILAPTEIQVKQGRASFTSAPLGVIFGIEPWTYPYYQVARVVGPNLMAGNTVVMKHAPGVP